MFNQSTNQERFFRTLAVHPADLLVSPRDPRYKSCNGSKAFSQLYLNCLRIFT
ncbi:hypothetical protein HBI56_150900 [Parastagonospora nodorum]|uniref:Uncharacterized protein n=1 Tax=Phaeosphaeria nodorum (strain SN15 / ATCC MYA-4574 / FGSC 10173) TaxID=321614 RepID=A0A7U2FF63_PHANO|nr:hypothetical protein HBH56_183620 [Parastagonospora nodorum]QRD04125.1 hypothetical protein JI435_420750 [Parastagonospora nodorum SN15]KAH3926115.1 hypothetical protein HBH54_172770 [Parastagonospora nodorum]KAH3944881.1 hypothetical protein HBH53_152160 [Parastagonospora nodorum]KAH3962418.1 hypothetical protein HBH52_224270 [Parastagonospora nodorum]